MTKESLIELQKIDCNCNDCRFLERDLNKFNEWSEKHYKWQWNYFTSIKNKLIAKANQHKKFGDQDKCDLLLKEAQEMKFQFDKSSLMHYGRCAKLNKDVSFIPNACQLDTQGCFEHRREQTLI